MISLLALSQIVLSELEERVKFLLLRQVGALDQILMHADRALDFPAPAEQRAEREMQFYCLRFDLDHIVERFYRLVRLLIEQEIEALEIRRRQRA